MRLRVIPDHGSTRQLILVRFRQESNSNQESESPRGGSFAVSSRTSCRWDDVIVSGGPREGPTEQERVQEGPWRPHSGLERSKELGPPDEPGGP